jgi:activator of HSP90 ATPase
MPQKFEVKVTYDIPASLIFDTLTKPEIIQQFTQAPAVSELKEGGKYMIFGDVIQGEYLSFEQNVKINMKWKFKEWASFGDCEINFIAEGGAKTVVTVTINDIPDHDAHGAYIHI